MIKAVSASIAALVLGGVLLWDATGGLRVFTAEGARRAAVERAPRPVPEMFLIGMDGKELAFPGKREQPLLVEFIYTNCPTICVAMGETFARLSERIAADGNEARLLSISFDPTHDDESALRGYAERHGADGRTWTIARPANTHDLMRLLKSFGVTVIPDGYGGFEHNAAVHFVDRSGRLAAIYGIEDDAAILGKAGRAQ